VGAIGFAPGFAYLEGLDPALKIPRRDAPRTRVPSGSVAIAAGYSGIYPSTLPGGWHILGRTRRSFFQKEGDFGSLLSVGDQVKFEIISVEAYEAIESDF
jgi:KipI family sensor histidine kinase inhibitor